jgi:hypothetical protein
MSSPPRGQYNTPPPRFQLDQFLGGRSSGQYIFRDLGYHLIYNEPFRLKYEWQSGIMLDFAGVAVRDTALTSQIEIQSIPLNSASNQDLILITSELQSVDETYAEMGPTDYINLIFSRDPMPNEDSSSVFYFRTVGYYQPYDEEPPSISLISPNGGELWPCDSARVISWEASDNIGIWAINLDYSIDGGGSWNRIEEGIPDTGSTYEWTIPRTPGETCKLRVRATDFTGLFAEDESDAAFKLTFQGNISDDLTWSNDVPIVGDVIVDEDATLRLEDGANLHFYGGAGIPYLQILGSLVADGNTADRCRFVPSDSSIQNWWGIRVENNGIVQLRYSDVAYAIEGITIFGDSTVSLNNCSVYANQGAGILMDGGGLRLYVDSTMVTGNTYGLKKIGPGSSDIIMYRSSIDSNSTVGIYIEDAARLELRKSDIKCNPDYGAYLEEVTGIIDSCDFYGNDTYGLYILGGLASLDSLLITNNFVRLNDFFPWTGVQYGVYFEDVSGLTRMSGNEIHHYYQGGVCFDASIVLMEDNDIYENDFNGVFFTNLSSGAHVSGNVFENNQIGVKTDVGCYPILGDGLIAGYNTLQLNSQYEMMASWLDIYDVKAENNYWGASKPPKQKIYGPVDYNPWLTYDPNKRESETRMPKELSLKQNFPNPFNPSTVIEFELPEPASVSIEIFNILGQRVGLVVADKFQAGFHQVVWSGKSDNGMDLASGVYFYVLWVNGDFFDAKKMMILK